MTTRTGNLLADLAALAEGTLESAGRGVCWAGVWPGAEVAWEFCDECGGEHCGMLYVRLASMFPSTVFPEQDTMSASCSTERALAVEVGVLRCLPVEADGTAPDGATLTAVSLSILDDAMALCQTIQGWAAANDQRYLLGAWEPLGPQGACAGGFWTFTTAWT